MSHRRYKCGKFPEYDQMFDSRKIQSGILNRGKSGVNSVDFDFWSKTGIQRLLEEFQGNLADGQYDNGHHIVNSRLKDAQDRLAAIDVRWENKKINAIRAGKYPPETMPEAWATEKLILQARLDVIAEEIDWLRKEVSKFKARKQTTDAHLILASGPRGTTAGADPPRFCDGQPIVWSEADGSFLIQCPKSPYNGMRLQDYYASVCKPWRTTKRTMVNELQAKADNKDLSEGERQRAAERAQMIRRARDIPPWPPRPEGA